MKITVLGIDIAKNVFQLHGTNQFGQTVLKKKLSRSQLLNFVVNLPPCLIGMEACGGAHHWAREFMKNGHLVKLMSPQFVKPYVKSNKNDAADAEAICEAVVRPNMRFVPIKQTDQQDIQCLHRIRERLVKSRTALVNEVRGLLHEYGVILPQQVHNLEKILPTMLSSETNELTPMSREIFQTLLEELRKLQVRIKDYENKIHAIFKAHPIAQQISTIPGVGPITATAIIAAVGDPATFKNGRQMAAWLGLVPRQASSGGKEKLLGISKRGDGYIRRLLIHGAHAALRWADGKNDKQSLWVMRIKERGGPNKAAVALANKNARIIWALMTKGEDYQLTTI